MATKNTTPAKALPADVEALIGPERILPLRTCTGQDLPAYPPHRCPRLKEKAGEVTMEPLYRYEGDDIWHSSPAEAGRCWLSVFGPHFPAAAAKLKEELRRGAEDLLA